MAICQLSKRQYAYGAPSHVSIQTIEELHERHIFSIFWPPFSLDLNPIETVWNRMRDWIQDKYPEDEKHSYDQLWAVVQAAWEAIPDDYLNGLINSMSYMLPGSYRGKWWP